MKEKALKIRTVSIVTFIVILLISLFSCFMVWKTSYLPATIKHIIWGVFGFFTLICLLITLFANRKWFQYVITVLLILCTVAVVFGNNKASLAINEINKVFTTVPEKTTHDIYLINHTNYMIIDEIDNKTVNTGMLKEYLTADIEPFLKEIADRNTTLNVKEYEYPLNIFIDWNSMQDRANQKLLSAVLPEELVELYGDIFPTETFKSDARIKHHYSEEISSQLNTSVKPDITKESYNILIGMNDARGFKSDADFLNRSDLNMILTVNPKEKKILLTVLPYDLLVQCNDHQDVLTAASFYGIMPWENAVKDLVNCNIDYFIRINNSSVAKIFDHFGPFEIFNMEYFPTSREVSEEDRWTNPAYSFRSGYNTMDGNKALVYLREKHPINDSASRWDNTRRFYSDLFDNIKGIFKLDSLSGIKETWENRDEILETSKEFIEVLDKSMATDLDSKALLEYMLSQGLNLSDWIFESQIIKAEYIIDRCFSANNNNLEVGIIPEEVLASMAEKISEVYGH